MATDGTGRSSRIRGPRARVAFSFENMRHPVFGGEFDPALERHVRFFRAIGARDGRVCRQVHGTAILPADSVPNTPVLPSIVGDGDGLWTTEPNTWVGVYTADCLPILIDAGPRALAVHAGWRGLAAGIVARAVEVSGGAEAIASVTFGPSAGGCCYCVGDDVRRAFEHGAFDAVYRKTKLDLAETALNALRAAGYRGEVRRDFGCTICSRRYQSYRRDGARCGLNLSAITPAAGQD